MLRIIGFTVLVWAALLPVHESSSITLAERERRGSRKPGSIGAEPSVPGYKRRSRPSVTANGHRTTQSISSASTKRPGKPSPRADPQRDIAVCFVGQFIRHPQLENSSGFAILRMLQGVQGSLDAFVASSTQHVERNSSDSVDSEQLCLELRRGGFMHCETQLLPYNGSRHLETARSFGLQLDNGLFPFRIASFFSTIQRCLGMVHQRAHRKGTEVYGAVVVTRLDVLPHIHHAKNRHRSSGPRLTELSFWHAVAKSGMVAQRKPMRFEDRFFCGELRHGNEVPLPRRPVPGAVDKGHPASWPRSALPSVQRRQVP